MKISRPSLLLISTLHKSKDTQDTLHLLESGTRLKRSYIPSRKSTLLRRIKTGASNVGSIIKQGLKKTARFAAKKFTHNPAAKALQRIRQNRDATQRFINEDGEVKPNAMESTRISSKAKYKITAILNFFTEKSAYQHNKDSDTIPLLEDC